LKWWVLLILALLAATAIRVFVVLRRLYAQRLPGWDEKMVRRLREQGLDPFAATSSISFSTCPTHRRHKRSCKHLSARASQPTAT
jgi:hypothetical protein